MKNIHFRIDDNGFVTPEINNGIIENENNVTLITADFPDIAAGFEKYIIFKTKKPVEIVDGSKTRLPQVLFPDSGYVLPAALINGRIDEVAFKAISEDGSCFTTEAVKFIPLCGTLSSDSLAPSPLPTGFWFEEGSNITLEDTKQDSIRKVKIGLKTPLAEKLSTSDISGLESSLSSKVDKVTGKSLISDSEIARLAANLPGTASGSNTGDETADGIKSKLGISTLSGNNTGDQDLSGLIPKTDIVTDFSGGEGKPAGAEETKALKANKSDKVVYITADFNPYTDLTGGSQILIGSQEHPIDLLWYFPTGKYYLQGYCINYPDNDLVLQTTAGIPFGAPYGQTYTKNIFPVLTAQTGIDDFNYNPPQMMATKTLVVFFDAVSEGFAMYQDGSVSLGTNGEIINWESSTFSGWSYASSYVPFDLFQAFTARADYKYTNNDITKLNGWLGTISITKTGSRIVTINLEVYGGSSSIVFHVPNIVRPTLNENTWVCAINGSSTKFIKIEIDADGNLCIPEYSAVNTYSNRTKCSITFTSYD